MITIKDATETKYGLLHIRFFRDDNDGFTYPATPDRLIIKRDAFEAIVESCRRFYERVSDEEIAEWNDRMALRIIEHMDDAPLDGKAGYIYLAYVETGQYKIGRSKYPKERVKVFDTKMPVKVDMVHTFFCDDAKEAEKILHEFYAHKRLNGEWFDLTPLDVEYIKRITEFSEGEFITGG